MNSFFASNNQRNYQDFKQQISPKINSLFDSLREYCLSLGDDVIEDVRMHRVVFCKTMTFRWFADMEPLDDSIVIKIHKNRKEPIHTINLGVGEKLDDVKNYLKEAYEKIR